MRTCRHIEAHTHQSLHCAAAPAAEATAPGPASILRPSPRRGPSATPAPAAAAPADASAPQPAQQPAPPPLQAAAPRPGAVGTPRGIPDPASLLEQDMAQHMAAAAPAAGPAPLSHPWIPIGTFENRPPANPVIGTPPDAVWDAGEGGSWGVDVGVPLEAGSDAAGGGESESAAEGSDARGVGAGLDGRRWAWLPCVAAGVLVLCLGR